MAHVMNHLKEYITNIVTTRIGEGLFPVRVIYEFYVMIFIAKLEGKIQL